MERPMKPGIYGFLFFMVFTIAACGGGGGSSPGGGTTVVPTAAPTIAATPTAAALSVSGTAQEYTSGAALGGFTVTVGQVPNAATCLNGEAANSMPCGIPASPLPTVTTSATGAFSIALPTAGTYMLTIGKDATYATLHRTITVVAGTPLALGTVKIAALSADEQAWVTDVNNQRANVSTPVSFANLAVDEYAEEQARAEVAAIVSGAQPYGDVTEGTFLNYYVASPGAMYGGASVAALVSSADAYLTADGLWMAEKANCPNGWQACSFASNTGHYINISSTGNVWLGLGESASSYNDPPYGTEWAYAIIFPANNGVVLPTSSARVAPALAPSR
jgi:hypothetical protein